MGVVDGDGGGPLLRAEPRVITLASTSPRRKAILRELGLRFRAAAPDYRERNGGRRAPGALVREHALGKALAAARSAPDGVVIGADTVVWHGGRVIGKPRDMADARRTLAKLQGRRHAVYTAVALLRVSRGRVVRRRVWTEKTLVRLEKLSPDEVRRYFRRVNPLDKAGSYAIQARTSIVKAFHGSRTNAMGLPAESLIKNLNIIK